METLEIHIDDDLRDICKKIVTENKTIDQWSEIESCDMYQSNIYCGGFDADEEQFLFSYYHKSGEWWFSFSIEEAHKIINDEILLLIGDKHQ